MVDAACAPGHTPAPLDALVAWCARRWLRERWSEPPARLWLVDPDPALVGVGATLAAPYATRLPDEEDMLCFALDGDIDWQVRATQLLLVQTMARACAYANAARLWTDDEDADADGLVVLAEDALGHEVERVWRVTRAGDDLVDEPDSLALPPDAFYMVPEFVLDMCAGGTSPTDRGRAHSPEAWQLIRDTLGADAPIVARLARTRLDAGAARSIEVARVVLALALAGQQVVTGTGEDVVALGRDYIDSLLD